MNILEARRRTLGADVYKKTVQGNPVSARSLARMRPGLSIMGKSTQQTTTGAQLFNFSNAMQKIIDNWNVTNILSAPDTNDISIQWENLSGQAQSYIAIVCPFSFETGKTIYITRGTAQRFLVYDNDGQNITNTTGTTYTPNERFDGYVGIGIDIGKNINNPLVITYDNNFSAAEPYTGGKPSPSTDYPQEITSAGDDGNIEVTVANDGYVEKGTAFENIKKIPLLKGSYVYLKSNIGANKMNTFVVDDPNLIETIGGNNSNALYSYCVTQLGISSILPNGSTISGNARLSASWGNGVQYKIEQDGLYLYYANNNRVNDDAENTFVWFLDHEGSKERPYASQSLTVQTPNGLPGIPVTSGGNYTDSTGQQWICDEIDFKRRKYVQRVVRYTGPYGVRLFESNGKYFLIVIRLSSPPEPKYKGLCNITNRWLPTWSGSDNAYWFLQRNGQQIVIHLGEKYNSGEAVRQFLDENEIIVYYIAETPIETDLTPEQMAAYANLHTNRPTTVVSATDGAGLELTYKTRKSLEVTD